MVPFGAGYSNSINIPEEGFLLVTWFCQLLVVVPFSWYMFRLNRESLSEVTVMKKELRRSSADLQFLRSQINTHFLFNALNTLYDTNPEERRVGQVCVSTFRPGGTP